MALFFILQIRMISAQPFIRQHDLISLAKINIFLASKTFPKQR